MLRTRILAGLNALTRLAAICALSLLFALSACGVNQSTNSLARALDVYAYDATTATSVGSMSAENVRASQRDPAPKSINLTYVNSAGVVPIFVHTAPNNISGGVRHRYSSDPNLGAPWTNTGTGFYAAASALPGTVPFYEWSASGADGTRYGVGNAPPGPGFVQGPIVFYAYTAVGPNRIAVFEHWRSNPNDWFWQYTTESNAPAGFNSGNLRFYADSGLPTSRLSNAHPEYQRFFGPGLEAAFTSLTSFTAIGNSQNGIETRMSQRLRVPPGISGTIKSVRYYSPMGPGYAAGNGGLLRFQILPDDGTAGHLPVFTAAPLAQGDFLPISAGMENGLYPSNQGQFQSVQLGAVPKVAISAGQLIHVYIRDMALNIFNWSGVNVRTHTESQKSPNRWLDFADAGVQLFQGPLEFAPPGTIIETTLTPYSPGLPDGGYRTFPILQIEMDNGQKFGVSDMETYSYGTSHIVLNTGDKIAERFNLLSPKTVDMLSVRFAATTAGSLAWRLRAINGGPIVKSGVINAAANYSQIDTFGIGFLTDLLTWVDIPLYPNLALSGTNTFDVEFEALSGSFVFAGTVNGSEYGFSTPAAHTESGALRWNGVAYQTAFLPPIGSTPPCCNFDVMFRTAVAMGSGGLAVP